MSTKCWVADTSAVVIGTVYRICAIYVCRIASPTLWVDINAGNPLDTSKQLLQELQLREVVHPHIPLCLQGSAAVERWHCRLRTWAHHCCTTTTTGTVLQIFFDLRLRKRVALKDETQLSESVLWTFGRDSSEKNRTQM